MVILDKDYNSILLTKTQELLSELPIELKKNISSNSWTNKAQANVEKIIKVNEIITRWKQMSLDISPIPLEKDVYEMCVSVLELDNLCNVLEWRKKISGTSQDQYSSKLKVILRMPLTIEDEDYSSKNLGRNCLFELNLYIKLLKAGYSVKLGDNPDISIEKGERKYAIECKRIFIKNSYEKNIKEAIGQLKKCSLDKTGTLGVVAIDYSRYFFGENSLTYADSEEELAIKFREKDSKFANETIDSFKRVRFSSKIPFLLLIHKGVGYVRGIPYSYSWLNIQETDFTRSLKEKKVLLKDFNMLSESINGKPLVLD
ncbi:MAG TPA: hypothetical protein VLG12_02330 [Candidatus Saccharimonadales bacterium]|nr:hypothetical protein [Candidatus Saccharimonadales bacterium]